VTGPASDHRRCCARSASSPSRATTYPAIAPATTAPLVNFHAGPALAPSGAFGQVHALRRLAAHALEAAAAGLEIGDPDHVVIGQRARDLLGGGARQRGVAERGERLDAVELPGVLPAGKPTSRDRHSAAGVAHQDVGRQKVLPAPRQVGGEGALYAVPWTEPDEPQAAIGSTLQKLAYPANFAKFVEWPSTAFTPCTASSSAGRPASWSAT